MTQPLPSRPSLEHLKNQAKTLLRAARAGDLNELSRFRQSISDHDRPPLKLADAQRVIAHEYGFANWTALKQHVEDLALAAQSREEQIGQLVQCCCDGELARAERIIQRHPELATDDIYVAAAIGELATVRMLLQSDPTLLNSAGGPLKATPLVYACSSRFAATDHPREPQLRAIAQELLERGADPNAHWLTPAYHFTPLSALYGACGANGNAAIGRLLLEAGATPDDNESLYHSVEHNATDCTELLLKHGARITGTNAVHNAIGLGNVAAVELFLQHGANVDERIGAQQDMTLLQWAIECNQPRDLLELLIDHGADVRATSRDGRTAYRRAIYCGHRAAAELLAELGAAEPLSSDEEFFAACMLGDEARARRWLNEHSGALAKLPMHAHGMLNAAAWRGNLDAVSTMLAIGFDVAWTNAQQATALHAAAWKGYAELVKLLLKHGAPLDGKDAEFRCTPLEWALHGSQNCHRQSDKNDRATREEAYATIVRQLVAAGSPRPVDRLVRVCTGRVQEILDAAGITVDEGDSFLP